MRNGVHAALAGAAAAVVAVEAATTSQARYAPECLAVAAALAFAWRRRQALRTEAIVALAFAMPAAVALVHLARHVHGDVDIQSVYPSEGQQLLHGTYPHSEYPPGAVVLFAVEEWIGSARSVNPFSMAVCAAAIAWGICRLGSPNARWAAAFVALWPVNLFFWEFKFDALPTACLVLGALAAVRRRFALAGVALGVGTAVKWSPAVAAALLAVWLLSRRETRNALRHALGFAAGFCVVVVPFLAWRPAAVWASVSRQAPRGITPESIWYLPLHALGRAIQPGAVYDPASVPAGADTAAVAVQIACLVALAVLLAVRRPPLPAAVAVACTGPAAFLLLNKVFSAQYALTLVAAGAVAAVLVGRALAGVALLAVASAADVLVYPVGRFWLPASFVLFLTALVAVGVVVQKALTESG